MTGNPTAAFQKIPGLNTASSRGGYHAQTHGDLSPGSVSLGISLHLLSMATIQDLLAVDGCVALRKPITTTCFGPVPK